MKKITSLILALLLATPSAWAQTAATSRSEGTVSLDFNDVDIRDVVRAISEITGKNFVVDERARGKISILSPTPVTVDEAYQAFLSALEMRSLCTVEVGPVTKIVPLKECKTSAIVTETDQEKVRGDQPITKLIPLKYINVNEAHTALRNLVSSVTGSILAYGPTNTLIITDTAANIRRLGKIIEKLDRQGFEATVQVIPLQHSQAEDVAEKLTNIFEGEKKSTVSRSQRRYNIEGGDSVEKIMPDRRTNSLIVVATRQGLERVLDLLQEIDRPVQVAVDRGRIHVRYLKHASAAELSKTLSSLLGGSSGQRGSSRNEESSSSAGATSRPQDPFAASAFGAEDDGFGDFGQPAQANGGAVVRSKGGMFEDEVRIVADPETNSLIVTASPSDYQSLEPIIDQLDVRRNQVFVETLIMEVNLTKLTEVGVSGHGGGEAKNILGVAGTNFSSLSSLAAAAEMAQQKTAKNLMGQGGLVVGAASKTSVELIPGSGIKIPIHGGLFRALQTNNILNVLSAPNILTTDNKKAEFLVGSEVPFVTQTTQATTGQPIEQINRQKIGISLSVTPRISEGESVTMDVEQKIQSVDTQTQVKARDIITNERLAKTTVVAEDGQTIVIGGLITETDRSGTSKVPLLGDIPLLGYLFRDKRSEKVKQNLIIFLTPHIIRDPADMTRVSVKKNDERRRFNKKHGIKEHHALYDYELDKGLNMAPPVSRRKPRSEELKKKRFDYDSQPLPGEEEHAESEIAQERKRSPRINSKVPGAVVEDVEELAEISGSRAESRKKPGNPFSDVRPPSSR